MTNVFLTCVLLLTGCAATSTATTTTAPSSQPVDGSTTRPILGLPAGWALAPKAAYTAHQASGEVTLRARGQNPTGGYEVKLVQSPLRIWPPQWMLAHKKPDGIVTQAFTPFDLSASFKSDQPVKQIVVTDAAGRHEVAVEQQ